MRSQLTRCQGRRENGCVFDMKAALNYPLVSGQAVDELSAMIQSEAPAINQALAAARKPR